MITVFDKHYISGIDLQVYVVSRSDRVIRNNPIFFIDRMGQMTVYNMKEVLQQFPSALCVFRIFQLIVLVLQVATLLSWRSLAPLIDLFSATETALTLK